MSAKKKTMTFQKLPRRLNKKMDIAPVVECPVEFVRKIQKIGENSHTGALERVKPAKAAIALWRMAQGVSLKRITEELGICHKTLRELSLRNQQTLAEQKSKFATIYAHAASEYTELLFEKADRLRENPEQLDAISPDRLAVTVGIMSDHAAKLAGMANTVIEHRSGASIEDAAKMIEEARKRVAEKTRNEAIEAELIC